MVTARKLVIFKSGDPAVWLPYKYVQKHVSLLFANRRDHMHLLFRKLCGFFDELMYYVEEREELPNNSPDRINTEDEQVFDTVLLVLQ